MILASLSFYKTRLQTTQRTHSLCPTSPSKASKQRKDESSQSRMYSAVSDGSHAEGYYSFTRLVVVTWQLVLLEWVNALHCEKAWTLSSFTKKLDTLTGVNSTKEDVMISISPKPHDDLSIIVLPKENHECVHNTIELKWSFVWDHYTMPLCMYIVQC